MPGPCSGKNLISILVTDYIQKRRGLALLFSFGYNLLPTLISSFNALQWNLDLRKILGVNKIFLKSRFFLI